MATKRLSRSTRGVAVLLIARRCTAVRWPSLPMLKTLCLFFLPSSLLFTFPLAPRQSRLLSVTSRIGLEGTRYDGAALVTPAASGSHCLSCLNFLFAFVAGFSFTMLRGNAPAQDADSAGEAGPHVVTSPKDCSVAELARQLGVSDRDIWLPFHAYVAARDKETALVEIPDATPVLLRDQASGELWLDRRDILVKLCLLDQRSAIGLRLAPSEVPRLQTLYLRWDRATGVKRVVAGTEVLHWALSDAQAYAWGCTAALPPTSTQRKRRRTGDDSGSRRQPDSVDGSTLVDAVRGARDAETFLSEAAADLERRLEAVYAKMQHAAEGPSMHGSPTDAAVAAAHQAAAVRQYAMGKILQCREMPPMHLLPRTICRTETLELPEGTVWARPDSRILCRVFRAKTSIERSTSSKYTDASRQVAFFFAEDVLLLADDDVKGVGTSAAVAGDPSAHSTEVAAADSERSARRVRQQKALAAMGHYAARGCRVVVLDHFPDLHHGGLPSATAKLLPLVRCIEEDCSAIASVTVVISVMSCITAGQKRGISASFLLPNVGLLQFFVSDLNSSMQVYARNSVVVGTRHRGNAFLDGIHSTFASNAGLPFVEVDDLEG